jgi:hypothetical protein
MVAKKGMMMGPSTVFIGFIIGMLIGVVGVYFLTSGGGALATIFCPTAPVA